MDLTQYLSEPLVILVLSGLVTVVTQFTKKYLPFNTMYAVAMISILAAILYSFLDYKGVFTEKFVSVAGQCFAASITIFNFLKQLPSLKGKLKTKKELTRSVEM